MAASPAPPACARPPRRPSPAPGCRSGSYSQKKSGNKPCATRMRSATKKAISSAWLPFRLLLTEEEWQQALRHPHALGHQEGHLQRLVAVQALTHRRRAAASPAPPACARPPRRPSPAPGCRSGSYSQKKSGNKPCATRMHSATKKAISSAWLPFRLLLTEEEWQQALRHPHALGHQEGHLQRLVAVQALTHRRRAAASPAPPACARPPRRPSPAPGCRSGAGRSWCGSCAPGLPAPLPPQHRPGTP